MDKALWTGFFESAAKYPDRIGLNVGGHAYSYRELREAACRLASTIQTKQCSQTQPLTAVFAYRTPTAFIGVLATLLAGNGYVPLNRTFPVERTSAMLERSECRSLIVDGGSLPQLAEILPRISRSLLILLPDSSDALALSIAWPEHTFVAWQDFEPASSWNQPREDRAAIAYLLFTSGSTGVPKGVMVSQGNVRAFVDYMVDRYRITESDRFSQMFDMTFDLSVFDMFVCWEKGACLCCPSHKALISPSRFIIENELTIWFSVPSTAAFMKQLGTLKPGRFPSLRLSLFCGEPLPVASAAAWSAAAPNSIVENLYGPTELTIACTLYQWNNEITPRESEMEIVPIGYPYPNMGFMVVNEQLEEVPPGVDGELLMNGPQMSLGYWKDVEKTSAAFVVPPGQSQVYYRTGDRVRRPKADGPITHLGRIDFQIKVLGHRVELGEIESQTRAASGLDGVVAVGWPINESGCGGVVVFVEGANTSSEGLRDTLKKTLPEYMVPRQIHFMRMLPRNANNKYDRNAMIKLLKEGGV